MSVRGPNESDLGSSSQGGTKHKPGSSSSKATGGTRLKKIAEVQNSEGEIFLGELEKKRLNGRVEFAIEDPQLGHAMLRANFKDNSANGAGEVEVPARHILVQGNFLNNRVEGVGKVESREFSYMGQWSRNQFSGYGRIVSKEFAFYEGMFHRSQRDGIGVEIYRNSDIFVGEFRQDMKHGLGIYFFAGGGYYYGFFAQNKREGFGELVKGNHSLVYRGFWEGDLYSGRGEEYYDRNCSFDGFFRAGKRHGVGLMRYGRHMTYLGEWEKGQKHGQGRIDIGSKVVTGIFRQDRLIENAFADIGPISEKLAGSRLPEGVEAFLRTGGYTPRRGVLKNFGELYALMKDSLVGYCLSLAKNGVVRIATYLKIRNLFRQKKSFGNIIEDAMIALRLGPDYSQLNTFFEPNLADHVVSPDSRFAWTQWEISEPDDNESQFKSSTFELVKSQKVSELIFSEELVRGVSENLTIEGVLNNQGAYLRFYDKDSQALSHTTEAQIFPFFLIQQLDSGRLLASLRPSLYTGTFTIKGDKTHFELNMFLSVAPDLSIYNVSIDAVGLYVVAGRWDQEKQIGSIVQKYFQEYIIRYEIETFSEDRIKGSWNSTALKGGFLLRKDKQFKFNEKIAESLGHILSDLEGPPPDLEPFMRNTIAAVLIKHTQESEVEKEVKVGPDENQRLFDEYKKRNENSNIAVHASEVPDDVRLAFMPNPPPELRMKSSSEPPSPTRVDSAIKFTVPKPAQSPKPKNTDPRVTTKLDLYGNEVLLAPGRIIADSFRINQDEQHTKEKSSNQTISMDNVLSKTQPIEPPAPSVQPNEKAIIAQARKSLNIINQKLFEAKVAQQDVPKKAISEDSKKRHSAVRNEQEVVLTLSNIIQGLKQVEVAGLDQSTITQFTLGDNIVWVGSQNGLGKDENMIIDNMFIAGDQIEGTYTDQDGNVFELAGSFSARTKEMEIIGMNASKDKTIKLLGVMKDFEISGSLTRKPSTLPPSLFKLKIFGFECRLRLKQKDGTATDYSPGVVKLSMTYVYLIGMIEKDYIFLNGFREGEFYKAELTSTSRKYKSGLLIENKKQVKLETGERLMVLKNQHTEIEIYI